MNLNVLCTDLKVESLYRMNSVNNPKNVISQSNYSRVPRYPHQELLHELRNRSSVSIKTEREDIQSKGSWLGVVTISSFLVDALYPLETVKSY